MGQRCKTFIASNSNAISFVKRQRDWYEFQMMEIEITMMMIKRVKQKRLVYRASIFNKIRLSKFADFQEIVDYQSCSSNC